RGPLTPEQALDLERIRKSQQHLLGIINDLLNFSRIEAGQIVYDLEDVPINDVIDAITPMILPQAAAKSLRFDRLPCPPDVMVHADATKLEQIILNLLTNAVKFTPAGGLVSIACTRRGDYVG